MITRQDIAQAALVQSATPQDRIMMEIGGSIRRLPIEKMKEVMTTDDTMNLRQNAWGVKCLQNQSSQNWEVVGNQALLEEYISKIGRYLVTNDGKAVKLSATDSSKYADGTAIDETKGHIMVIAPKLYCVGKKDQATGITTAWFSMEPIGGDCIANCNNGEHICLGAYEGALDGTALVSRSGKTSVRSKTINQLWTAAQVNGKGWGLVDYDHARWLLYMGISKYGSPNIQSKLGYGLCGESGNSDWAKFADLPTGATKAYGDACCSIPVSSAGGVTAVANTCHVSLFGVENWWGKIWQFIQGIYCGNSENANQNGSEVFLYAGNRMPTSAELTTHPAGTYRQLQRVTSPTSGYIKELILGDKLDILPKVIGGGSTSYWGDYSWQNTTGQVLLWGGRADYGSSCGLAVSTSSGAWTLSHSSSGSRLAYFGKLTFVQPSEI